LAEETNEKEAELEGEQNYDNSTEELKGSSDDLKNVSELSVSDNLAKLAEDYEGYSKELYNDSAGYATIGIGHLVHKGKVGTNKEAEKEFKNGLTDTEVLKLYKEDLADAEAAVKKNVKVKLTQKEFDTLV